MDHLALTTNFVSRSPLGVNRSIMYYLTTLNMHGISPLSAALSRPAILMVILAVLSGTNVE